MKVTFALLFILAFTPLFSQTEFSGDSLNIEGKIFVKVDAEADFPGSNPAWRKHLERNLYVMAPIENGAPAGIYTVIVQFIVDKEGIISDVKALTNFGYGMEEEVIRVIKKGPKWQPAVYKGKPVKSYRTQPVTFVVGEDGFEITMQKKYVLYTDTENEITIHVDKVKNKDLELQLREGTIRNGEDGLYWIRVTNPGTTILSIYNKKKNNKLIGSVYFIVKKKVSN